MTNQPPPIPTVAVQSKKSWPWWQIVLAIIVGLFLLLKLAGSGSLPLEVQLLDQGYTFTVTNIGDSPITIDDMIVNDRRECKKKEAPRTLKIGEKYMWGCYGLGCNIVRVKFETDKGTDTFAFGKR
ncbi:MULTISPECIES: hypothetical protein [unclassified Afipia]|uniref:hypothetical protein n=1 Tax=unclassified Afipia TaxID=2642050 RepID=UPI000467D1D5|nr:MULTISPECIES: hypothetical protein [unclassified Afipia]